MLTVAATIAMAALVGFLTLGPPSGDIAEFPHADKVWHFLGFAALVLPTALLTPRDLPKALILLILFGAAIELVQPFVGRARELADFLTDVLGLGAGAWAGLALRACFRRET